MLIRKMCVYVCMKQESCVCERCIYKLHTLQKYPCIIYRYIHLLGRKSNLSLFKQIIQPMFSVLQHSGKQGLSEESSLFSILLLLGTACNSLHLKGFLYISDHY